MLGIGYGAFPSEALRRQLVSPSVDLSRFRLQEDQQVHSAFLGTLAETGVVGLVLFVGTLAVAVAAAIVAFGRLPRGGLARGTAAALVVAFAGWASTSVFLSSEPSRLTWMLVGIASALLVASRAAPARRQESSAHPSRSGV